MSRQGGDSGYSCETDRSGARCNPANASPEVELIVPWLPSAQIPNDEKIEITLTGASSGNFDVTCDTFYDIDLETCLPSVNTATVEVDGVSGTCAHL